MTTVDSDDSVVGSCYMVSTILVSLSRDNYGTSVPLSRGTRQSCPVGKPSNDYSRFRWQCYRSRYMVSTMLIWIVQQDSGKSLSFFLLLRSTCFTADRQPANSAARWRHCRYFYTVVSKKAAPLQQQQQPAGGSFSSRLCLCEADAAMRRRRGVAVLGGGRGLELLDYTVAHSLSSSSSSSGI